MKFADINRKLTEIVADYISRGYVINTNTMNCLESGTKGKVDVTDGKEIIRILLEEFREEAEKREDGWAPRLYGVRLVVGRATENLKARSRNFDSIWNHNLDIIYEHKFYRVGGWDSDWYGSIVDAVVREDKHRKRISDSWESEFVVFGEKAKGIVLPFLRRQKNCKTATVKNITRVSKRCREDGTVSYIVSSKGRDFVMNRKGCIA